MKDVGYKVAMLTQNERSAVGVITLLIPDKAIIVAPPHVGKKRTNKAFVSAIRTIDGRRRQTAYSWYARCGYEPFVYPEGQWVTPAHGFEPNRERACGGGIHFYSTVTEALKFARAMMVESPTLKSMRFKEMATPGMLSRATINLMFSPIVRPST